MQVMNKNHTTKGITVMLFIGGCPSYFLPASVEMPARRKTLGGGTSCRQAMEGGPDSR